MLPHTTPTQENCDAASHGIPPTSSLLFIIIAGGGASLLTIGGTLATAENAGAQPLSFTARVESAYKQYDEKFFWFHTRAAALPGFGKDGQPAVVMTLQKHLVADDHYTGLYVLRTDDLGKTWTGPTEIPELAWRSTPGGVTIAVIDVTPGWHAPTPKLIAIGAKILYTAAGDHASLYKLPRSYETSYRGKRGQDPFAGTARRVLRTKGSCPLVPRPLPSPARVPSCTTRPTSAS